MKSRIWALLILGMGLFLYFVPSRIFPICGFPLPPGAELGALVAHRCYRTLQVAQFLAGVAVLLGLAPLILARPLLAFYDSILTVLLGVAVILTPLVIAPVCQMPTMACRLGTLPALVTLGVLFLLAGGAGLILFRNRE